MWKLDLLGSFDTCLFLPVISGPEDHIFVNFADHGGPGVLAFPNDMVS